VLGALERIAGERGDARDEHGDPAGEHDADEIAQRARQRALRGPTPASRCQRPLDHGVAG